MSAPKYDEDFKKSIVALYQAGKSQSQLSKEYGVSLSAVSRWVKQYSEVKLDAKIVSNFSYKVLSYKFDILKFFDLLDRAYGVYFAKTASPLDFFPILNIAADSPVTF